MSLVVEAMVTTLTEHVFTALINQAEFALDFSGQFEQLKTGLDLTKALLADTESLNHKNNIIKAALFELREVIYKADDVLTDCLVRDEYRKDRSCSGSLFHDPFFLHRTGKKLKDINLRMKEIEQTLGKFLRAPDNIHREDAYQVRVMVSQDWNPTEIIGLDSDVEKIKGWLFDTSKVLSHVGIVGMGGLGKTTIAQKIFHDLEVVGHFHKLIWVCVSQSFSADRIMRSILEGLGENASGAGVTQILSRIQQVLTDKSCLIVMDDVWNQTDVDWWTNLCSVIPKQSSCIIVTTRNEEAVIGMGVESSRIHRPKTLNDEESWRLFSKFAFPTSKGLCPEDRLEKLGKELLKKCGGLPLAIKTIGSLLASKVDSPSQWRRVLESFHALTTEGKTSSVMASLRLSYDELPPGLKQCLLCFSIYPEDYEIRADQLIHWWIGEGLVQSKGSRTAVEVGYEYLAELISRCLVEIVQHRGFDGRVYKCKIHDMVRELIIMIAEEEELCGFDEQGRQKLTANTRWLCFIDEMEEKSLKRSSKLRALLMMSSRRFDFERNSLRSLRMLDLSNCTVDEHCVKDLFSWISSLKRLATLNLSGIQALKEVPSSIHKLLNLQLLLLTGCSNLEKIHPSITNLKKLIILDLGGSPIQYLHQGLGRLSYLQEFSGFKIVSQPRMPCFRLLEIRELINLRVLRIHVSSTTVIADNELDVLSQLRRLNVLAIDAEDCRNNNVLEMVERLTPPPSLQELYLRNYKKETLPSWVNPGQLSRLQYLCIENGDLVKLSSGQTTWNLEGLCLKYLMRLDVDWKDLEKDMPVLRYMEISHCYNLKDFPCSVMEPGVWRKN
ncbi:disease resistance RPP13-like protein 4 [Rosa chinensis]|uniref:disease resistance RPP13-like protein 4 n=1 Tax=Rosa chinensis TaxID=74649 RepID=UPI000D08A7DF|nr:disease resistance RPP13-like protein 4 [Rosa chinensis]XP_024192866.1 disease resistance RPP13-like protein 4 [Rosa chinensis]XP_024192867.1 disease resistance RPP13-like protein 4 [Rosa chinensis]XP_024192868.1 disease resistance RPP13-like protein 4 [Rosa chinensis]XP_024192869.1 disease resistance RPP13-like protein 4 [Rosa chinensis]